MQLRSTRVEIECDLDFCGPECLLRESEHLTAAIPEGMGKNATKLSMRNMLFRTGTGTVIKRRKHFFAERTGSFGLSFSFDQAKQDAGFELLRRAGISGVCRPMRECRCCYEVVYVDGALACPAASLHAAHLAQKYQIHQFADRAEALTFVRRAWAILADLHRHGLQHGDPTHYNFVVSGEGVTLIDLDDLMYTGETFSAWDFGIFYLYTLIPVLSEHFTADDLAAVSAEIFGPALAEPATCREALTVLSGLLFLPVVNFNTLSQRSLSADLDAEARQIHYDDLKRRFLTLQSEHAAQGETIAQLQAQLAAVTAAATERLRVIETQAEALETLRLQQQQMAPDNEVYQRAFESLNLVAEARLKVIEEQQAALESYRRRDIKQRIRRFLTPQLGLLYQYPPKPLAIPRKYFGTKPPARPPVISIVTPSYNQGGFIERTIQSVLDQGYPRLEYIIQDGASTDDTMQVVEKYKSRLRHYESVKDGGQTCAINLGFRHATGEIMAWLNSDDLLLPGALNYVGDYFSRHPEVDVVYGHRIIVDEADQEVGRWVMPPHDDEALSWADYVPQETLFWRRAVWEKAGGGVDESFQFAMDWDLLLRLRASGARMRRLPRFLGAFRVHPHQKTSARITEIGEQEMARLRERCAGRPVSWVEINNHLRPYLKKHVLYRKLHRYGIVRY